MNYPRLYLWIIPWVTGQITDMVQVRHFGLWGGLAIVIVIATVGVSLFYFLLDRYWTRKHD